MNRIDRISAILIHLQSRKVVKAQDIADRFEISLRTVYRDIRTLEQAGIPLIGEAGMGYSIVDGFRLPPVMFSPEEALALFTAEKLVAQLTDGTNAVNYHSAMYKIKAVMTQDKQDLIQNISDHIEVFKHPGQKSIKPDLSLLQPVLKSVDQKKVLRIGYLARYNHQQTERQVEPLGVFYADNNWHLIAFCRMRNDYRDFRLNRISSMELTDSSFSREHLSLKDYLAQKKTADDTSNYLVIIQVKKSMAVWLDFEKFYHGFISEALTDDEIEMTFLASSLQAFARWFLMFGDHARIIQPAALRVEVGNLISLISTRLGVEQGIKNKEQGFPEGD